MINWWMIFLEFKKPSPFSIFFLLQSIHYSKFAQKVAVLQLINACTMKSKQILVGILIVAMVGAGISQLMPTLNIMASNAFSLIGIIVVVGLLGYGAYRILQD
ncbi:hypothetical protein Halhy_2495 [Haliscomenobacter hydrossis DSM 1100]|uniref:Uncharacterized protein n=2 Tax=Haliscomenobacteraceae TaxID=1937961 RepID=F4KXJ7_HALH1|nr:hypothetical protein Halhy_2495 [Haliscomenobacter hydrossis DSM 1100]